MIYKLNYCDTESGIIINAERNNFNDIIDVLKNHIVGVYSVVNCNFSITRINDCGETTLLANGDNYELLDILRIAEKWANWI